jgi:hypothetical protein
MLFVLICTEGKNSEPICVDSITAVLREGSPTIVAGKTETVPIPLGGTHGYTRLLEIADRKVDEYIKNPENLVEPSDEVQKWLICDYDDIERSNITIEKFREAGATAGYEVVINKPNFEYFVLSLFIAPEEIVGIDKTNYKQKIDASITELNKQLGTEYSGLKIPPYSKKKYVVQELFGKLFHQHPELIDSIVNMAVDTTASHYTEMPKLVKKLKEIYG